jgi:mono/diheme cytochrome c family protein
VRAASGCTVAALLALAACGGAQADVGRALQRMREQPKADPYESSGVFQDGKVLQVAPAGTVAREDVLDLALATGRDSAGAYLARVPVPVTPALLEQGRSRFRIVCGACHGPGGFGGSVVAANWTPPRPPSLRDGRGAVLPPGMVYEVVRNGFGRMPSYASDLPVADRWAIVAYALTIRGRPPADSAERDDSVRAAELRGQDRSRTGAGP